MTAAEYNARMAIVRQQSAKVAKANHPRNQSVKQPPSNTRAAPIHIRLGIKA